MQSVMWLVVCWETYDTNAIDAKFEILRQEEHLATKRSRYGARGHNNYPSFKEVAYPTPFLSIISAQSTENTAGLWPLPLFILAIPLVDPEVRKLSLS